MRSSVIIDGARTPIGKLSGGLAALPAVSLGAVALREALARSGVSPEHDVSLRAHRDLPEHFDRRRIVGIPRRSIRDRQELGHQRTTRCEPLVHPTRSPTISS